MADSNGQSRNELFTSDGLHVIEQGYKIWTQAVNGYLKSENLLSSKTGQVLVQVLGSGGPELTDGRASSSYLVWVNHKARLLVDFGSGAALNYEKSGALPDDLDAVLFSHFHVDHTNDFSALVKGLWFTNYDKKLQVFGPSKNQEFPGIKEFITALFNHDSGAYAYLGDNADPEQSSQFKIVPIEIANSSSNISSYAIGDDVMVKAVSVLHGTVPALAWRLEIKGYAITFSGDTSNENRALDLLAQGSDLLIAHNAARENDPSTVARYLHMMPSEIGRIAAAAKVRRLVLSHRMNRTLGHEVETTAAIRKNYQGVLYLIVTDRADDSD
ncbi:unnamed protein product [Didymodactylos carnosus]|uniref:Metallo-beta-lactamase domain-containing protein n=1 Tax=Didymodactylos carnosus TaxID=1234261 RepID=A0A814RUS3_9BILA|nr:unnamed protein product [Didymodactylos carnosus]CAF3901958.1 unnamed protein product [Didymodactylos carnosus]